MTMNDTDTVYQTRCTDERDIHNGIISAVDAVTREAVDHYRTDVFRVVDEIRSHWRKRTEGDGFYFQEAEFYDARIWSCYVFVRDSGCDHASVSDPYSSDVFQALRFHNDNVYVLEIEFVNKLPKWVRIKPFDA